MKIDHLSTTLGVENDVVSHCYVKYIIIPANFANIIMPRRHAQNGVIDDLHATTGVRCIAGALRNVLQRFPTQR